MIAYVLLMLGVNISLWEVAAINGLVSIKYYVACVLTPLPHMHVRFLFLISCNHCVVCLVPQVVCPCELLGCQEGS